ncbi:MAG: tRNA pseudouridine(55) synthase TruB [Candidatus Nanopelagicales bacterium]
MRTAPDGIVVIDKPAGMTSHDVVARVRRTCGTRAVGHAGTLDPMATGVLVLGVERATKLLGHLTASTKRYEAAIRLGVATNTEDADGEITGITSTGHISESAIREAAQGFLGDIMQVPSSVSAIKVDGVRSYARVRAGQQFELPPRPVTISEFTISDVQPHDQVIDVAVSVTCSAGTYIRALARDLGAVLGVGAHLIALRRTAAGRFTVADAQALPEPDAAAPVMIPLRDVLAREYAVVQLDAEEAALVRHGMRIRCDHVLPGLTGLLDLDGTVVALAEAVHGHWHYAAVFSS